MAQRSDQALAESISDDHVPPLAFFAPAIRTRHNPSQLITIPVHLACN
jgi:hypothetical protein